MFPIPKWTVDNSYLLNIVGNPTCESEVSLNPYVFDNAFVMQNGFNPHDLVVVSPTDCVDIKLREIKPVTFEVYSLNETKINALDIPESDFLKYVSPSGVPAQITALIPKR